MVMVVSGMVCTWAFKGLPYHNIGASAYAYTFWLLGSFGFVPRLCRPTKGLQIKNPRCPSVASVLGPRGSKYPIFEASGQYHIIYSIWTLKPQILGIWTLWGYVGFKWYASNSGRTFLQPEKGILQVVAPYGSQTVASSYNAVGEDP